MDSPEKNTLHTLAILHYIMAGLIALAACIPIIHLTVGLSIIVGGIAENEPGLGVVGALFTVIAVVFILIGWGIAFYIFKSAQKLDNQTNLQSCTIASGILCIFIPLGTVLGVITLAKLQEESVKKLFDKPIVCQPEPYTQ